jgi:predicted O-methyltransferase YrrM
LCDTLTVFGFLTKENDRYALTADSAAFLDRNSPAYIGGVLDFLLSAELRAGFDNLTAAVRKGGTATSELGTLAPEHPVWIRFARAMGPMMVGPAQTLASLVSLEGKPPGKILDISASHGMWGIAFARQHPKAVIVALDWAPVLKVAVENAEHAGISERFRTIAGSAFDAELGSDYDVVLIPNFLHHFNVEKCIAFLRRIRQALRPGGRVAIVEFVPSPDRVSPPEAARFSLVMLASTPEGDAYTLSDLEEMLAKAGFKAPQAHPLPPSFATAVIAERN